MDRSYALLNSLSLKAANKQRNNQNDQSKDSGDGSGITDAVVGKGGTIDEKAGNHG